MSIVSELNRLQQAKNDLATSIANKGVIVPAATTIDGYAALVDQIQQGGGTLPYDAEIEYLEANGTQYINTGILFSVGMTILINAIYTANYNSTQILVAPGAAGGQWVGNVSYNNGSFGMGGAASQVIGKSNIRTNMIINYYTGKTLLMGNGVSISVTRTTNPTTNPIQLFGVSGNFLSSARIYSCQIHDTYNNVLADFIPARVGQVGHLYDRISGSLFGNSGTGAFTLGPDVI